VNLFDAEKSTICALTGSNMEVLFAFSNDNEIVMNDSDHAKLGEHVSETLTGTRIWGDVQTLSRSDLVLSSAWVLGRGSNDGDLRSIKWTANLVRECAISFSFF
jgi:hypothetical protein